MTTTTFVYDPEAPPPSHSPPGGSGVVLDSGVRPPPPAPSRAPLSYHEMSSLLLLLESLQRSLLWHYCDWAELANKNQLPAADLEARAQLLFAGWQGRLVRHLQECLDSAPTVVVDAPPDA